MKMKQSEAERYIVEHFQKEVPISRRRLMDLNGSEFIGWMMGFQNRHPEVRTAFGQDIHQCVRSAFKPYIGPNAI